MGEPHPDASKAEVNKHLQEMEDMKRFIEGLVQAMGDMMGEPFWGQPRSDKELVS